MAVSINTATGFEPGAPRLVAEETSVRDSTAEIFPRFRGYDVAPDGERLLMILPPPDSTPVKPMIVQNWVEELNRLVPIP